MLGSLILSNTSYTSDSRIFFVISLHGMLDFSAVLNNHPTSMASFLHHHIHHDRHSVDEKPNKYLMMTSRVASFMRE